MACNSRRGEVSSHCRGLRKSLNQPQGRFNDPGRRCRSRQPKRFSGTGIDHARAFASMAGSLDMIVPFRIPDPRQIRSVTPMRVASTSRLIRSRFGVSLRRRRRRIRPPPGTGGRVLQLRAEGQGHRRRQEEDFRGARRGGPDRGAVAQAVRQAQAPPGPKAGPMSSGLMLTSVGRPIWF